MLMAGLDGIERGLDPGAPADYDLFEEADGSVPQVPGIARRGTRRPRGRPRVPARGDVFSEELIETWIDWKRENEIDTVRLRPHPAEFALYFDC